MGEGGQQRQQSFADFENVTSQGQQHYDESHNDTCSSTDEDNNEESDEESDRE